MAYATVADVQAIMPPDEDVIPSPPPSSLVTTLEEATDLIIGFLGREYTGPPTDDEHDPPDLVPDDVPGAVRRVVARVTLRAFLDAPENPGAESEVQLMGPFSHALNWSKEIQARDLFLTNSDELRLKRFVLGSTGGAGHAPMAGANGCRYG